MGNSVVVDSKGKFDTTKYYKCYTCYRVFPKKSESFHCCECGYQYKISSEPHSEFANTHNTKCYNHCCVCKKNYSFSNLKTECSGCWCNAEMSHIIAFRRQEDMEHCRTGKFYLPVIKAFINDFGTEAVDDIGC